VKLTSKDAALVPMMAVVSAIGHMAVGPFVNRAFHVPGPTLAGVLIMAPLLVAGALTFRRGMIMLTSTLNGVIVRIRADRIHGDSDLRGRRRNP
jgi:uncharacterized protein (DUF983 family)